jgi:hypothetical protein
VCLPLTLHTLSVYPLPPTLSLCVLKIAAFFVPPVTATYSFNVKLAGSGVSTEFQTRTKLYLTGELDKSAEASSGSGTNDPTNGPTAYPTNSPTTYPTTTPTSSPTAFPTAYPLPSAYPTAYPTSPYPTSSPTAAPTAAPTASISNSSSMLIVDAARDPTSQSSWTVDKSSAKLPLVGGRAYLLRAVSTEHEPSRYKVVSGGIPYSKVVLYSKIEAKSYYIQQSQSM